MFSIQTERTVAHDNTIVLQNRYLQLDKTRFRNTLAGCTVTVCEHLDGSLSVGYGPHVVGRFNAQGMALMLPEARHRRKAVDKAPARKCA